MPNPAAAVDVVGVGLNATDTVIRIPHFPPIDTKVEFLSADVRPGGQVASAMVACQRWGLRTRYIGKVGDDPAGRFQAEEFAKAGVETHLFTVPDCASQSAYIIVDEKSGERTILWKHDDRLELKPEEIRQEWITTARALLVDCHDTDGATAAARYARSSGIPVVADLDNLYPGVQVLLEYVNYLMASKDLPARLTGKSNLLEALPEIHRKFKCYITGATLGYLGALAWDGREFQLCRGYRVRAVDTTGAGDIFHGGFVFGLLKSWPLEKVLEFSCAAAALGCTAVGARGGIATVAEIEDLMRRGERSEPAFPNHELRCLARGA